MVTSSPVKTTIFPPTGDPDAPPPAPPLPSPTSFLPPPPTSPSSSPPRLGVGAGVRGGPAAGTGRRGVVPPWRGRGGGGGSRPAPRGPRGRGRRKAAPVTRFAPSIQARGCRAAPPRPPRGWRASRIP